MTYFHEEFAGIEEAAQILRRRPSTLQAWRNQRRGPAWIKEGKAVWYRRSKLREYLLAHEIEPEAAA
jgi:hypothetical protein